MDGDGMHVLVGSRMLRCGHTTGTCAAAASKAAAEMILSGRSIQSVSVATPKGIVLNLPVEDAVMNGGSASCAVRKDGGDDIDATHGALVYSTVSLSPSDISVDGGEGVGRVTRRGLDQPLGESAINRVPRSMIRDALEDVASAYGYTGGFSVVISVPEGRRIAESTFNPRLGIEGGISILGTSGIVEPMSETAIVRTIETEMDMRAAEGAKVLAPDPRNYGRHFTDTHRLDADSAVKCSNFIGEMLDRACALGTDILLIGNLGKMVKLAGGIMNTHSRNADCRMEILAAYTVMAGGDASDARRVMECISTDDALEVLEEKGMIRRVSELLAERIEYHMNHRTEGRIRTAAIVYSSVYGELCRTSLADSMLRELGGGA